MKLDPASPVPIFQQVADGIRHALAAGAFTPGDAIPSIRAQAVKLRINPNTIQRAYEQLERDGLIESRKGLGMFVTRRADNAARAASEDVVRDAFITGIRAGQAAGLAKRQIDEVYADAHLHVQPARTNGQPRPESKP